MRLPGICGNRFGLRVGDLRLPANRAGGRSRSFVELLERFLREDLTARIDQQTARIDQQTTRIDGLTAQVASLAHKVGALRQDREVLADILRRLARLEEKAAA
jgi:outer membrane murein-binding lipoprotein Lpp